MNSFLHELKERGVIRAAGLYAAVVWLLLQASDVLFPAFEIPDSDVKILLAGAALCLPFVLAFAWFYELTDKGFQREEEVREGGATRLLMGNEIYYVIICILALALSISVYMNLRLEEIPEASPGPISVLISDIDNQTHDPIFDGSVEQALAIGVEGASFITSYARPQALKIADLLKPGTGLDEERARLVALREGISLVLAGNIIPDGQGFQLNLTAIDPKEGKIITAAVDILTNGIKVDLDSGNTRFLAAKYIALAEAYVALDMRQEHPDRFSIIGQGVR